MGLSQEVDFQYLTVDFVANLLQTHKMPDIKTATKTVGRRNKNIKPIPTKKWTVARNLKARHLAFIDKD